MTFTLRQRVNNRASTISQYSSYAITSGRTSGNLYGATIKLSQYRTTQALPFTFRMAVTMPDGEPLVFYTERMNLPRGNGSNGYVYWEFFNFSALWEYILLARDSIPVGNYTFCLYMDDGLVATQNFYISK